MIKIVSVQSVDPRFRKATFKCSKILGVPTGVRLQKNASDQIYTRGLKTRKKRNSPLLLDRDRFDFREYAESCPLNFLDESGEVFLEEAVDFI